MASVANPCGFPYDARMPRRSQDEDIKAAAKKLAATAPPGTRERGLEALAEGLREQYPDYVVTIVDAPVEGKSETCCRFEDPEP